MRTSNMDRLQQRAKRLARLQEKQRRRCQTLGALEIYGPTNCPDCGSPLTERNEQLDCDHCGKPCYSDGLPANEF